MRVWFLFHGEVKWSAWNRKNKQELLSKSRLDSDERTERRGFEVCTYVCTKYIYTDRLSIHGEGNSDTCSRENRPASWSNMSLKAMDHLEVIKLLCKDFWYGIFRKQIDKQLQCEPTTSEKWVSQAAAWTGVKIARKHVDQFNTGQIIVAFLSSRTIHFDGCISALAVLMWSREWSVIL